VTVAVAALAALPASLLTIRGLLHTPAARHVVAAPRADRWHTRSTPLLGGSGIFAGLPSPFAATRYHSLTVAPESLPACLIANARAEDGTIQGFRHAALPIHGVQFHPESIASEHGHVLLANFLELSRAVAAAA